MKTNGWWLALPALLLLSACGGGSGGGSGDGSSSSSHSIVVNSTGDDVAPAAGTVTLRSALAAARPDQAITFAPSLDGATIALTQVADAHTLLKGEVMGMRNEASGPVSYLIGYSDRDYGRSSLVARKNVVIDASALRSGITIAWTGGNTPGARVLAVEGNLTLVNVAITGGSSVAEKLDVVNADDQPWTLGRGGALAVWGVAKLVDCRLYDNHAQGDFDSSRDRGAFGGAVYADIVDMRNCIVSGNTVLGGGAAGGGVYSVGGAGHNQSVSTIDRSSITGNRISAVFTYGGGVYSDGGSIGNSKTLRLTNSTIARNVVEPAPGLPRFLLAMGYWRGGGVYMSNGYLEIESCTIVENEVRGVARTDSLGRRNLAGGVAATVGNAHDVEDMVIGASIIAGNTVQEIGGTLYAHDVYTGSLFRFRSLGYNRIGALDFSQILVPVGEWGWQSLSRRHFPQVDDAAGVAVGDALDLTNGVTSSPNILSAGASPGSPAVLRYSPRGTALARVPPEAYKVSETTGEYTVTPGATDTFLPIVLQRIEAHYALPGFAAEFTASFEAFLQSVDTDSTKAGLQPYTTESGQPIVTLSATHWFGPAATWTKELPNYPYIEFWHRLDAALQAKGIPGMGPEVLGDKAWQALFGTGQLTENRAITTHVVTEPALRVTRLEVDQTGAPRPAHAASDIGAVEAQ